MPDRTFDCSVVASNLVALLGDNWEVVQDPTHGGHYSAIRNKVNGVEFSLSGQHHDNKIHIGPRMMHHWRIGGSFPTLYENTKEVSRPTIKMSPDKSVEKMVQDFSKRILDEGTKFFLAMEQLVKNSNAAEVRRVESRKEFAKLLGIAWSEYFKEHNLTGTVNGTHVSANPCSNDKVELTLSYLTQEKALKIMEILNG
jgi:hypothetical protein